MNFYKGKKLFIFDLDGTLADAYAAIRESLNCTRRELGLKNISMREVKKNVGNGDRNFINVFFPDHLQGKAIKLYREHHFQSLKTHSREKPQALRLLRSLKKNKRLSAIATNRPAAYTAVLVQALGFDRYLDFVLSADTVGALKPDPKILRQVLKKFKLAEENAVFIGDMIVDMETARNAGIEAGFVTGGSNSAQETRGFERKIIRSLGALADFIEKEGTLK